ncbi:Uncharacterised protein [Mycobacteroides abscessus subsp. massiliense]|uniref:Uncharacterized protein n=1 Tax=Mycobacteroides abscessus subsp. massiliense TaxID=1962118 RepID=A0A1U2D2J9_9MYCO|nr:hypothetical protein MMCCUG48898_0749 [Mycobacteroides abscessus subsp. massiliense CCUG 48898 = JCM 15300]MBL3748578.1 hypothetical protein [Mycobacteroides abscessus subsp. massiliense]ORA86047.1 hypothetical protein BST32_24605 [Mycobacteroides abscessus subsp. massiliense]SKE61315.1 Uncharacterised protein [Mycobacteroides abscessus subsp. massiliense]SKH62268.1 Uncharacterised protein [Mycobacteroides abscessus subsp. massiliense]
MIAAAAGWWRFDSTVLKDRRLHKNAATAQCIVAIRDSIDRSLHAGGSSEADSKATSAGARFSDVTGTPEPLSFDNHGVPTELGKKPSSVLTNWQIGGHVHLDDSLPTGSGLGPDNRFSCSVIVFDDNTIHVASRQVLRT